MTRQPYSKSGLATAIWQSKGQRRRWCCEPEPEPDAKDRAQRGEKEDECGVSRPAPTRGHLVDVGIHDSEVGADTNAGNCPSGDEPPVSIDHCGNHRPYAGDDHGHQEKIPASHSVCQRAEDQGADDIADEIEKNRRADIIRRRWWCAVRDDLGARLDERHVDVKNIVQRKKKADANYSNKQPWEGPDRDPVQSCNQHSRGLVVGLHRSGSLPARFPSFGEC
jgi:hypothetical protein